MNPITTKIPIERIHIDGLFSGTVREKYLSRTEIEEILKLGPIVFVVASLGAKMKKIEEKECYRFWKEELNPHLVDDPDEGFSLEDYPKEYAYIASKWIHEKDEPIILLEECH